VYYFSTFILHINTEPIEPPCGGSDHLFEIAYLGFLIPLLSAVRLAKFNISTNQTDQFIGMPTPANAIFFASSVAFIASYLEGANLHIIAENQYGGDLDLLRNIEIAAIATVILCIPMSLLLNIKTPLIALKFKTFGWSGNEARFILLGISLLVILGSLLISNIFVAAPIIILLYLIISIINNITKRAK
jgi:CDP-diacylglycerol--serine O-phosphatidyltransferase